MTARSSPVDFAAAACGRSSVRTAFQSTPFMAGSKCVSRMIVHAASKVSSPSGYLSRKRHARARDDEQTGDREGQLHRAARRRTRAHASFQQCLDGGGRFEDGRLHVVEFDGRERQHLLHSLVACFIVVGTIRSPNFL